MRPGGFFGHPAIGWKGRLQTVQTQEELDVRSGQLAAVRSRHAALEEGVGQGLHVLVPQCRVLAEILQDLPQADLFGVDGDDLLRWGEVGDALGELDDPPRRLLPDLGLGTGRDR